MPSTANIGYGLTLSSSVLAAANFVAVAQVVDVNGPLLDTAVVRITNNDSASAAHEKIPGLEDSGQITFTCIYKASIVTTLRGATYRRTIRDWRVLLADGSRWDASGFLQRIGSAEPLEDRILLDIVVELTGLASFTAA